MKRSETPRKSHFNHKALEGRHPKAMVLKYRPFRFLGARFLLQPLLVSGDSRQLSGSVNRLNFWKDGVNDEIPDSSAVL
ncbi:MAG TPA: hypothetical protein PL188_09735 [Candidatus Cloacimonadota bacterium]|nr:hypothetical protein [Candidatus Cloacimonadota bacterium]